jgi:hypothetical protein
MALIGCQSVPGTHAVDALEMRGIMSVNYLSLETMTRASAGTLLPH